MLLMLVFLGLLLLTSVIVLYSTRSPISQKAVRLRVQDILQKTSDNADDEIELSQKDKTSLSERLGDVAKRYATGEWLEKLILHTGGTTTVGKTLIACAGLGLALAMVLQMTLGILIVSGLAGAAASFLPIARLLFLKSRRVNKFNEALPDAIDLMSRALRAGHSTGSSLEVISQQTPAPLCQEFALCFQHQKFGIPFREALLGIGERVPSEDLHFFITAVLVQKETGGDLIDILDRSAKLIRERLKIHGEIQTKTAQGRLTGMILASMPIVMLVILNVINPGYSDVLFHEKIGKMLLAGSAFLIVVGGLIIRKIVDIKV